MFLEFLRQSKTSLLNSQGKCAKLMDNNARYNRSSPSVFGAEQHLCKRLSALAVLTGRHMEINTYDPKCLACSAWEYLQHIDGVQVRPKVNDIGSQVDEALPGG